MYIHTDVYTFYCHCCHCSQSCRAVFCSTAWQACIARMFEQHQLGWVLEGTESECQNMHFVIRSVLLHCSLLNSMLRISPSSLLEYIYIFSLAQNTNFGSAPVRLAKSSSWSLLDFLLVMYPHCDWWHPDFSGDTSSWDDPNVPVLVIIVVDITRFLQSGLTLGNIGHTKLLPLVWIGVTMILWTMVFPPHFPTFRILSIQALFFGAMCGAIVSWQGRGWNKKSCCWQWEITTFHGKNCSNNFKEIFKCVIRNGSFSIGHISPCLSLILPGFHLPGFAARQSLCAQPVLVR